MKQRKSEASSEATRSTNKTASNEKAMAARDRIEPRKPAQPEMQRDQRGSAARGRNMPKPKATSSSRARSKTAPK